MIAYYPLVKPLITIEQTNHPFLVTDFGAYGAGAKASITPSGRMAAA